MRQDQYSQSHPHPQQSQTRYYYYWTPALASSGRQGLVALVASSLILGAKIEGESEVFSVLFGRLVKHFKAFGFISTLLPLSRPVY